MNQNEMAAVTLMSTDIDRTVDGLTRLTDIWANLAEMAIGLWLLWRQLGTIFFAPLLVILVCFIIQSWGSRHIGSRQAEWVQAVQRRVGIASTILRSMKAVKLSGLVDSVGDLLQSERVREIKYAKRFRVLGVFVRLTGLSTSSICLGYC
jgi:ATP-binding cassette subfamily C (CFTR/MRP) protein 1